MASKTKTIENCLIGVGYTKAEVTDLFFKNPDLEYDKIQAMKFLSRREKDLLRSKRNMQLQALRMDAMEKQVDASMNTGGDALMSTMVKSGDDFKVKTVEGQYTTIRDQSQYKVIEGLETHKGTWGKLFAADKEFGERVLRAMHGEDVGDAAASRAAKFMGEVTESLRLRYNKAGGNIGKIADWNMVHTHDTLKIGRVSPEEWMDQIEPLLNMERMGVKSRDDLRVLLKELYEDIESGGINKPKFETLSPNAKAALANRVGGRHRALHFNDVDDYLKYQNKFGSDDTFASMMSHIDTMSKDIAVMEAYGPDPNLTFKHLKQKVVAAARNPNEADRAEKVFKDMMGETMAENAWVADRMGSARAAVGAGKLKFAAVSAISDVAFMGMESHFAGVPVMKAYSRFISQMWESGDKRLAAHVAGVAEYAMDTLAQTQRYAPLSAGSGWANKAIAFTVRASGLEAWTNAGKRAFALEFSAELGRHLGKKLGDMPDNLRRTLKIYGIDEADWKALKGAGYKNKGTTYLSLQDIQDPVLAAKYGTMMRGEMKYAVPEPGWKEQAFMKQGTQSGTVGGEILRTGMQFKSYPITVMMTWWARIIRSQAMEGTLTRAGYAGAMMASTTMLGVAAVSAKDVLKGKTPPPLTAPKTLWRGYMQGGTAGPMFDFLVESSEGKGFEFLGGPMTGEAIKLATAVTSNTRRAIEGKETHLLHSLLNQARGLTPGTWYAALAMRRMMADPLNRAIDPDQFRQNARRAKTRARKDDQEITWAPGKLPEIMR